MSIIAELINKIFPDNSEIIIPSIMPISAIKCIQQGNLPQLNTKTIFMKNNEKCYYIERAILITEKNIITGYNGTSGG